MIYEGDDEFFSQHFELENPEKFKLYNQKAFYDIFLFYVDNKIDKYYIILANLFNNILMILPSYINNIKDFFYALWDLINDHKLYYSIVGISYLCYYLIDFFLFRWRYYFP